VVARTKWIGPAELRSDAAQPFGPLAVAPKRSAEIGLRRVDGQVPQGGLVHSLDLRIGAEVAHLDEQVEHGSSSTCQVTAAAMAWKTRP